MRMVTAVSGTAWAIWPGGIPRGDSGSAEEKNHRVITGKGPLFTIPVEAVFNNHPQVFRSALTGVGPRDMQTAVMCIEAEPGVTNTEILVEELYALADKHPPG